MVESDFFEFGKMMSGMANYYGKELSDEETNIFWEDINAEGVNFEQFKKACSAHRRKSKWFPKISELIEIIKGGEASRLEIEANMAWDEIRNALYRYGADNAGKYITDEKANHTLRLIGGWPRLRIMRESDVPWVQKEFVKLYEASHGNGLMIGHDESSALLSVIGGNGQRKQIGC